MNCLDCDREVQNKDYCLHFEDAIDSLKLKADSIKGILHQETTGSYKAIQLTNKKKEPSKQTRIGKREQIINNKLVEFL